MTANPVEASSAAYTRLHVTPLDADLIKVVLSSALLPRARNISYHTIETFPDKRYGFLELPTEDADKLRKKLHGSILKGVKVRVEPAKPSDEPTPLGEAAMAKNKAEKSRTIDSASASKPKKRKRDAELEGVVLEEGRKVKRGWTETAEEAKEKDKKVRKDKKDKKEKRDKKEKKEEKDSKKEKQEKKRTKSKYTDHPECLVKTILPPNAVETTDADSHGKKKKKGKSREVVIHEFERTAKFPTFLKSTTTTNQQPAQLEFVEGKGWVDEEGNVVETVKSRRPATTTTAKKTEKHKKPEASKSASEDDSEDEESDDSDSSQAAEGSSPKRALKEGAESPEESLLSPKSDSARPKSSGSTKSLSIRIPPTTPKESKVHPLEALFKPAQAGGSTSPGDSKPFTFFGNADSEQEDDDPDRTITSQVPMTPFTRQEFESRGIRSAAPTPDTAHPGRRFIPWEQGEDDIAEDEDEDNMDTVKKDGGDEDLSDGEDQPTNQGTEAPTSDFQKFFWENRGDLNRSWKKRRKQAGKEKRYRENRARMSRAI